MPAPFSRDCQAGTTATASDSPLPHVAAALAKNKRIKILSIGASASAGRGALHGGYTGEARQILRQAIKGLDVVMINRGVSGELASQAAWRIKNEVALVEPDLVLWQVGTNDALAYVSVDELQATVVDTLTWLKEHKIDTVLVGLQYIDRMEQDEHYRNVREMLRKVATQENILIVRRYEAQRLLSQAAASGGGLFPDEFQRTEAGYTCLAQYMARAITLGIFGPAGLGPPSAPPARPPQPRM
ncbi:MAG TPA: SGNH/GDSL hydrolase family protein [Bradyrhizobium sp.]|nr:SGNH/GDSL hydrolase family protein [Bradyrhizobium sp.]